MLGCFDIIILMVSEPESPGQTGPGLAGDHQCSTGADSGRPHFGTAILQLQKPTCAAPNANHGTALDSGYDACYQLPMKFKGILAELGRERKHMLKQVERLEKGMAALAGLSGSSKSTKAPGKKRRKMSKAGRLAIAAAQRARWAKVKAAQKK